MLTGRWRDWRQAASQFQKPLPVVQVPCFGPRSLPRSDPQYAASRSVGDQIELTIGSLTDVADALAQVLQEPLLLPDLLAAEFETHQQASSQRADKQVVAPLREQIAGIERHAGR